MGILYFTALGPQKVVECYRPVDEVLDSALVTRTGFTNKALSLGNINYFRDYIKADRGFLTEVYLAFRYEHKGDEAYSHSICSLFSDNPWGAVFGMTRDAGSPRELYVYRMDGGGTYSGLGGSTGYSLNNNTVYTVEIYWKMSDTVGEVKVWLDGTQVINLTNVDTLPTGGFTSGANMFTMGSITGSAFTNCNGYWGEIICSTSRIHETNAQRLKMAVLKPNGAGGSSGWTGAYGDVDEQPPSDSDLISVNSADAYQTFTLENLGSDVEEVKGVRVWNRAWAQGGPTPRKVAPAIRTNSTNYAGTGETVPSPRPVHTSKIWENNPNTSNPWSISEVNALEAGCKSET